MTDPMYVGFKESLLHSYNVIKRRECLKPLSEKYIKDVYEVLRTKLEKKMETHIFQEGEPFDISFGWDIGPDPKDPDAVLLKCEVLFPEDEKAWKNKK